MKSKLSSQFPKGWNEARVKKVLAHYEHQSDAEAMAEDRAAYRNRRQTIMTIPIELVENVRVLLARKAS